MGQNVDATVVIIRTKTGADMSGNPYNEEQYNLLVRELHGEYLKPPAAGPKPNFSPVATAPASADAPVPAVQPPPTPAQGTRPQNAIAYAFYETTGPNAKLFKMYVRPVDEATDVFNLETSDGDVSKGCFKEIAREFVLTDWKYLQDGYIRMNKSNASGRRELDLP
jgi:hypothetical protein